jgi:hypothetical protein
MSRTEQSGKKLLIFSIIALLCAVAVFLSGFFIVNHLRENYARYSADQITDQIIGEMKYTDLVKIDQSQLSKHYDIPDGVVSECSVYMSKSSESASELACFLLKDQSKFEVLQTAVNTHITTKASGFKSLNPVQYNALKNCLIVQDGRYVLVAVGNNTSAEEKLFRSMLS